MAQFEAMTRRCASYDGYESACTCGWYSPPQASEVNAEVVRDRHMATAHGITATPAERAMKGQLAQARRDLDMVTAQRDALKMGADPNNLTTPPEMVKKFDSLARRYEATEKDLITNLVAQASEIRALKDRVSTLEAPQAIQARAKELEDRDSVADWVNRANAARSPAERFAIVSEGLKNGIINRALARKMLEFEDTAGTTGIQALPLLAPENPRHVAVMDEASLADLLCDDA